MEVYGKLACSTGKVCSSVTIQQPEVCEQISKRLRPSVKMLDGDDRLLE